MHTFVRVTNRMYVPRTHSRLQHCLGTLVPRQKSDNLLTMLRQFEIETSTQLACQGDSTDYSEDICG